MMNAAKAERWLRILLGLLVFWDVGLAIYAIGFPHHFENIIHFVPRPEPLFIRGVGVYWLFAGWMQLLGWRNPRQYLTAVQLTIIFRLSAAVIDSCEVIFLLPSPMYFLHYLFIFFIIINIIIAGATITFLRKMDLPWVEFKKH